MQAMISKMRAGMEFYCNQEEIHRKISGSGQNGTLLKGGSNMLAHFLFFSAHVLSSGIRSLLTPNVSRGT